MVIVTEQMLYVYKTRCRCCGQQGQVSMPTIVKKITCECWGDVEFWQKPHSAAQVHNDQADRRGFIASVSGGLLWHVGG
jgi:hypothetical protein